MILGEKIIRLRKQREWSQEELASQLGISRQSVSKWESGASIPDLDKIIKMSSLFGVTTDYLLKEEIEEDNLPVTLEAKETEALRSVSLDEALAFLDLTRKTAAKIASGVSSFPTARLMSRISAVSETYASRQPFLPQVHCSPSSTITMCPSSLPPIPFPS